MLWKWNKGAATDVADFGDPLTSANARLCIYDGPSRTLVAGAIAPAGGLCAGKPCWKPTGTKGFVYKDKLRTPSGIQVLKLKAGDAGKAVVGAKAKGELADVPRAAAHRPGAGAALDRRRRLLRGGVPAGRLRQERGRPVQVERRRAGAVSRDAPPATRTRPAR